MACVDRVDVAGPDWANQTIVHLRDYHFVTRDVFGASVRSVETRPLTETELDRRYAEFLVDVERVQSEQIEILRRLVREFGVKQVFAEGLTERDMAYFRLKIDQLKDLDAGLPTLQVDLAEARQRLAELQREGRNDCEEFIAENALVREIEILLQQHRLDVLRVGAAGRLLMAGELDEVIPLEDQEPFEAANPISEDGTVRFDTEANRRREEAQTRRLLKGGGLAVVVLGGGHDLTEVIGRLAQDRCRYISVASRRSSSAGGL